MFYSQGSQKIIKPVDSNIKCSPHKPLPHNLTVVYSVLAAQFLTTYIYKFFNLTIYGPAKARTRLVLSDFPSIAF